MLKQMGHALVSIVSLGKISQIYDLRIPFSFRFHIIFDKLIKADAEDRVFSVYKNLWW